MTANELSRDLDAALISRDIQAGLSLLKAHKGTIREMSSSSTDAGVLLGCVAKWIDFDFCFAQLVELLLNSRFPKPCRYDLPFRDVAYIRFAEGVVRMHRGIIADGIRELTAALCDAEDLDDIELRISCNYFIARCFRISGLYKNALEHANAAEDLSWQGDSREKQVATIRILKAWLEFQGGDRESAEDLLEWATVRLNSTSDYVSKGNGWSLQARMARRIGRAHLELFSKEIHEYETGGEEGKRHPNLARALANRALAHIIDAHPIVVQLREKGDERDEEEQNRLDKTNDQRQTIKRLHEKANQDLARAENICRSLDIHHVLATCCLRRAFMCLEQEDSDKARKKVMEAYELAREHDDYITMGRAKVLECMIEHEDYAWQVGSDPRSHAQLAYECASEAVALAERTENNGLFVRAHLAMGFALLDLREDDDKAAESLKRAEEVYNRGGLDFLSEYIRRLKVKTTNRRSVTTELGEWIRVPEGKSVYDLEDILYRLVWEHVGHRIGRVAENLQVDQTTAKKHLVRAGCLPRVGISARKKGKPAA